MDREPSIVGQADEIREFGRAARGRPSDNPTDRGPDAVDQAGQFLDAGGGAEGAVVGAVGLLRAAADQHDQPALPTQFAAEPSHLGELEALQETSVRLRGVTVPREDRKDDQAGITPLVPVPFRSLDLRIDAGDAPDAAIESLDELQLLLQSGDAERSR